MEQLVIANFFLLCVLAAGSVDNKLLSHRNAHSGTGVTLPWSWQIWAIMAVELFYRYQKAEREKNHQYLLKQWPKPKTGGERPDAHTNVVVKHLIGFGGILLFSRLILLVFL